MTIWVCAKCGTAFGEGEAQRTFAAMLAALKAIQSFDAAAMDKLVNEHLGGECTIGEAVELLIEAANVRAAIALAEGEGK